MIFRVVAYFVNIILCLALVLVASLIVIKCILRLTMKISSLAEVPLLEPELIEEFVKKGNFPESDESKKGRRTRSLNKKVTGGIVVDDVKIRKDGELNLFSVEGTLNVIQQNSEVKLEAKKGRKKKVAPVEEDIKISTAEEHKIRAELNESGEELIHAASCKQCKDKCPKIFAFLLWIQQRQSELEELENNQEITLKKIKRESTSDNVLKPVNIEPLPTLPKLKKEITPPSPVDLESAQKLSLVSLIQEFNGQNAQQFLEFCGRRMQEENYSNAEILTVEQADTDLWHELRKGRITASRIHEASRCSMLRGSLCDKIMGIKSGFSFAMKRGTDLEGHVFAVLQKEYPSLRNAGLVLDPQFPWMGASPDGLADDFVLEIKCPYTPKTYECYIDVNKLSKKYFAQIQLQMHMTHKTKALLGVAALDFEKSRRVTQVWIDYDKQYVDKVMAEAFEFWTKGVFPVLLRKRKAKK